MKRVMRTAMMALLVMVLCVGLLAPAAQAAQEAIDVTVSASVKVTGTPESGATATFELTPDGGEAEAKTIDIKEGTNTVDFDLSFSKVGVYEYTFRMVDGTYYQEEYDGAVYHVKITVFNNEDYTALESQIAIREEGKDEKPGSIDYELKLVDVTVNKKWIDQDSTRPDSVSVNLLCGDQVCDTVVLSSKNSWQYTWTKLDSRLGEYSVKEAKVPTGYTATYKYADGVWTITNTGSLLQTGQLNWPIPVLTVAGVLMIVLGVAMTWKKKEESNG